MPILRIIFLLTLIVVPWLAVKDYYTRGEAREALVVQAMLESGNLLLPLVYDENVPSKPPFFHWLGVGVSVFTGGVSEFATRLPSALASIFFGVALFFFLLRQEERMPWLSVIVLLTSFEWFRASITTRVDLVLSVCGAGALLALYEWYERRRPLWFFVAIVLLSFACLTKGPVGIILPLGVFGVFLLIEERSLRKPISICAGALASASVIPLLWYVAALEVGGERFIQKIYYENVQRFSGTMADDPHNNSALYLFGTLMLGFLPWLFPPALSSFRGDFRSEAIAAVRSDRLGRFCATAVVVIFVFYAIPESKRSTYLLMMYPFFAVILSRLLVFLKEMHPRLMSGFAVSMLGLGSLLVAGALIGSLPVMKRFDLIAPLALQFEHYLVATALGVIASIGVWKIGFDERECELQRAAYGVLASLLIVQATFAPAVANSVSYRPFTEQVESLVRTTPHLYSFGDEFYGFSFYWNIPFRKLDSLDELSNRELVILYERNLDSLIKLVENRYRVDPIARSDSDVVRKGRKVVLVSLERM